MKAERMETLESPLPTEVVEKRTGMQIEATEPGQPFWQSQAVSVQNIWQLNFPQILQRSSEMSEAGILGWFGSLGMSPSACANPRELLGCHVASSELMEAVLRHSAFDAYHFLDGIECKNPNRSQDEVRRYLESLGVEPDRVAAFRAADNVQYLSKVKYHAVHRPAPDLMHIARLRRAIGASPFPITGMTHTISYAEMMPIWLQLLLGDLLPCDTLVCTSTVARKTLETIFVELSERLSQRTACENLAFPGRLEVIPLGIDADYWSPAGDKTPARTTLGLAQDSCVILCPGRFSVHDKMDLAPLLIAIRRLADKRPDRSFQLILTGDIPAYRWNYPGTYASRVRALVHELGLTRIVRIEISPAPAVMRLLFQASDIFISLSDNIQETFGLTVVQAMACGLPAVVSDWDGYRDTVVHGETGFRARSLWAACDGQISDLSSCRSRWTNHLYLGQSVAVDLDEVTEYLDVLTANPDLRNRLGCAGRQRVEERFAWPVIVRQYERLWSECQTMIGQIKATSSADAEEVDIFHPSYFSRFAHYASQLLNDNSTLTATDIGLELMSKSGVLNAMMCCDDMRYVLCTPIFAQMARHLERTPVVPMGELARCTAETFRAPSELVVRHILWLIKYGALRVVDSAG